jgi:hypothetical protein
MNTKIAFAAIAIVTVALVVTPALVGQPASARKQEICTLPSGNPCVGATADKNPQRDEKCQAGNPENFHPNCP